MNKSLSYLKFSILLGFISCNMGTSVNFEVVNESTNIISNITISTSSGKKNMNQD